MDALHTFIGLMISTFIVALGLSQGLSWHLADLGRGVRDPAFARGLGVCLVGVPLLSLIVVKVLPVPPVAAGVISLMAFCPGLPMALNVVSKQKGNLALTLALSVTLSLVAIVLMPLSLKLLERLFPVAIQSPPYGVLLGRVILPFLVPFAIGIGFQKVAPGWAHRLRKPVKLYFNVALSVAALALVVASFPLLKRLSFWAIVAMVVVTLGATALGHVAGRPRPGDRTALAISAVFGNPAFAFCLGGSTYPMKSLLGVMGLYLFIRTVALIPYLLWNQRHQASERGGGPSMPSGRRASAGT
ncbi:bile acid:sodium symporter [Corallococcus exiguus]|uniref:bile acid:sodium symporter family protein n=1 Tax=Corallococcus TaxID=83461 RepID=UPI000EA2A778|nr:MULTISPECIES: bile acid:sodium symporter [Corallococcus]NNC18705.1 symporter [Corallococcus exiguus]NRD54895.1 bile acid:sodium symporter [Corallococcus exiguus]NRD62338.1 bile acid:sodium symporter [Corallococcus exiguus]RKH21484.1 symporter [Corallococcus sp. CA041A]RKI16690.1 symporter [Corallococcus sp. AB030]